MIVLKVAIWLVEFFVMIGFLTVVEQRMAGHKP